MQRAVLRVLRASENFTPKCFGRQLNRTLASSSLASQRGPARPRLIQNPDAIEEQPDHPSSQQHQLDPKRPQHQHRQHCHNLPPQQRQQQQRQYHQQHRRQQHQQHGSRLRPVDVVLLNSAASMLYRRGTAYALLSTLVGFGAWITYGPSSRPDARSLSTDSATDLASAAATRKVLVLGQHDLQTGTFVGDGPITKTTADGRRVVEMLTPGQATKTLRRGEESIHVQRGEGVVRYDVVQLPSNDPIEDDHAEQIMQVIGNNKELSDWMFWGVFDGHGGWTTSAKLRQSLIAAVSSALNETYIKAGPQGPSGNDIDATIKSAFLRLDDEIVHKSVERVLQKGSKVAAAEALAPAIAGSCALLSFYDARTKELRVACTGDSRAVLGRRAYSGKWTATALSDDQTGSNPDEVRRIRDLHPDEPAAISKGRILGQLEPSRAFGDASYKWSNAVTKQLRQMFFGARSPSPYLLTPPYVTAEPVVTTTLIRPDRGDFVVMATDGLWEMLTNEEVVGLVGKWLDSEYGRAVHEQVSSSSRGGSDGVAGGGSPLSWTSWLGISGKNRSGLPVEHIPDSRGSSSSSDGAKTPVRKMQWGMANEAHDHFVVRDKNAATHLIRNALGGKMEDQVCSLLTLPAPTSRRYRDDLTVQVIFFGRGESTGEIKVNVEATSPNKMAPKSKL